MHNIQRIDLVPDCLAREQEILIDEYMDVAVESLVRQHDNPEIEGEIRLLLNIIKSAVLSEDVSYTDSEMFATDCYYLGLDVDVLRIAIASRIKTRKLPKPNKIAKIDNEQEKYLLSLRDTHTRKELSDIYGVGIKTIDRIIHKHKALK